MCLTTKTKEPLYAEEDIVCYKVVKESKAEGCPYMTPYEESLIHEKAIKGIWMFVAHGIKKIEESNSLNTSYDIGEGYIHTYKYLPHGKYMNEYMELHHDGEFHLFECIIPRGTEYYVGSDLNGFTSYASERIKFVKKIY